MSTQIHIDTLLLEQAEGLCKVLNNPFRLKIFNLLLRKPDMIVTNIYKTLHYTQSVTSQQLGVLRKAGLVTTERRSRNIYYSANPERLQHIQTLAKALFQSKEERERESN
jgi:DNA-binding transcriptional ArsR family regulator